MAASSFLLSRPQIKGTDLRILDSLYLKGLPPPLCKQGNFSISERLNHPTKRNSHQSLAMRCTSTTYCCSLGVAAGGPNVKHLPSNASNLYQPYDDMSGIAHNPRIDIPKTSCTIPKYLERMMLADLDPPSAKLAIGIIGPFLSAFAFLFIIRIVMSWYPKLPVGKFPYVIAYAPTEPLLIPTRKLIPPLGGVDVTPVVWFGLVSFLSEILVGPQGLLVLLSQQV